MSRLNSLKNYNKRNSSIENGSTEPFVGMINLVHNMNMKLRGIVAN